MKAICLTINDEALKSHNLLGLYEELPERSRERIESDFTEIKEVMKKGRQTFGAWRYFEKNVGEKGIKAMVDVEQARAIAKAARVILDEGEMVGLEGTVSANARENVRVVGEKKFYKQAIKLNLKGREAPPLDDST